MSELQPLHRNRCDIFIGFWKVWSATAVDPISLTPSNRKSQLCIFIYSFIIYSYLSIFEQISSAPADPISDIRTPPVPMWLNVYSIFVPKISNDFKANGILQLWFMMFSVFFYLSWYFWLSGSFSTSILVYSLNISHKTEPDLFQKDQISDEIEPTVCFTLFFIFYISTKVSIMSSINWSNRGFNFTTKLPPKINCW